ncbi:Hypothetical predicted protein [Podarcis lilfordi]|uniref:Uncharacterized protein n=1 Tax=Podarcis lilfordi TaxID=74358 RepID=A0AA35NTM8_9SAUR|nr:Hypothetical predicted protein [Podarcis lilfordi]
MRTERHLEALNTALEPGGKEGEGRKVASKNRAPPPHSFLEAAGPFVTLAFSTPSHSPEQTGQESGIRLGHVAPIECSHSFPPSLEQFTDATAALVDPEPNV